MAFFDTKSSTAQALICRGGQDKTYETMEKTKSVGLLQLLVLNSHWFSKDSGQKHQTKEFLTILEERSHRPKVCDEIRKNA